MRKKRGELTGKILSYLVFTGALAVASTSPYFAGNLARGVMRHLKESERRERRDKFRNTFYYLRKKGYIETENRSGQIYISLTKEGKEKAGEYGIDDLKIKKPKKWDRKWRVLLFDIEEQHRAKREALRGKIKQLGLYKLQKSVWVCPYEFDNEIKVLREFFNLSKKEMTMMTVNEIEDSEKILNFFNLKK